MTVLVDFAQLLGRCVQQRQTIPGSQRQLIALAGAPGSGKSTLAERLVGSLNAQTPGPKKAVVVPMDGFHLDNAILAARDQLPVKGAPQTFDVDGFNDLLLRLRRPLVDECDNNTVYFPVFDRAMDLARVAAGEVSNSGETVVVEGNYLLLQSLPWRQLKSCFDLTIMLDVPLEELERRLVQRWLDYGLNHDDAHKRALSNDIPNARVVLEESFSADLQFHSVRQ